MTNHDALQRLLRDRHSCRAFSPEPLPRALIDRMFQLAQRTASWCNVQPWHAYVLSGAATDRFRAVMVEAAETKPTTADIPPPVEYRGSHLDRRRATGAALYSAVGVARGDKEARTRQSLENFRFFGAPHVAIVTCDAGLGPYGLVDVGGYLAVAMLAAESLGIGLIAQAALAMQSETVRQHLRVPTDRLIVAGMSLGYKDEIHPANQYRTSRAELNDTVTWLEE